MTKKRIVFSLIFFLCVQSVYAGDPLFNKIKRVLKKRIIENANWALTQSPLTVTATNCERSAGGVHDFYSEGDYWWPNPEDLNGPYIQKDGLTNPENFTAHRKAMIRFSQIIGSLTSAYIITRDEKYVLHAKTHLKAWFIDEETFMNPSLLYAQAIKGKVTGRGIGIIDMIQMIEVAQSVSVLEKSSLINNDELQKIKNWFTSYLNWLTTHPYGIQERDTKNNHATCWVMQVAVFSKLTGNQALFEDCRKRFKTILLPGQMDDSGSFPLELNRTKPYGYSLFNLDAISTICHVLTDDQESLWDYSVADGHTIKKAVGFMYPYVKDKTKWPFKKDVMYWDEWPVAHPFLIFAFERFKNKKWFTTWKGLEHYPQTEEVIRNLPIRNPLIWIANKK